ncbi:MAG: tyrosine-type recombinase/integrase [Actinomycetes bacterium]
MADLRRRARRVAELAAGGGPVEPRNFNRSFARVCAAADLGSFRPHDARHTCASLLGELNVDPRTAMEILGHSRSSVTLEIYRGKRQVAPSRASESGQAAGR